MIRDIRCNLAGEAGTVSRILKPDFKFRFRKTNFPRIVLWCGNIPREEIYFIVFVRCYQQRNRMLVKEILLFIFINVCKHCAVLHMMSINYGVPVGKAYIVSEVQEYTAGSIPLAAEQVLQIIAVIPSLYNRIVDLRSFNVDPGNDVRVDLTQYRKIHLRPNRVVLIRLCFCLSWLVDNRWLWFGSFLWKRNHVTDILVSSFTGVILGSNHPYLPCRKRHDCEKNGCEAA